MKFTVQVEKNPDLTVATLDNLVPEYATLFKFMLAIKAKKLQTNNFVLFIQES